MFTFIIAVHILHAHSAHSTLEILLIVVTRLGQWFPKFSPASWLSSIGPVHRPDWNPVLVSGLCCSAQTCTTLPCLIWPCSTLHCPVPPNWPRSALHHPMLPLLALHAQSNVQAMFSSLWASSQIQEFDSTGEAVKCHCFPTAKFADAWGPCGTDSMALWVRYGPWGGAPRTWVMWQKEYWPGTQETSNFFYDFGCFACLLCLFTNGFTTLISSSQLLPSLK